MGLLLQDSGVLKRWGIGIENRIIAEFLYFAGFYYYLDENLGTEKLTISDIKRTIDEGDLTYSTMPIEVEFEYSRFGKYQVIGFMC
ncbi:MAG: hypothetical protein EPN24_05180 [Candidatus Methanoperedens sp.]|nr:MAG: hypothetical protein EPN24_05180 [Candidatus Methanoperedens sp.]